MPDPPLINEDVRIDGTFRDNDGNLADVAGLTVTVREPDATLVSYSGGAVVQDSVGEYHAIHPAGKIGTHDFRWTSGTGRVVLEGEFYVAESLFDAPEDWQPISAAEIAAASQVDFDALGLTPRRLETLWALMTDAMRDFWIARFAGIQEPSFAVTEPDFAWPSEAGHGVRTSDFPWEPFYFEPPGWPGWGWE
jgi:hypothetical protein